MTIAELRSDPAYKYHHTASRLGYVSRRTKGVVQPYRGRYGVGYIALTPRWDTMVTFCGSAIIYLNSSEIKMQK